MDFHGERRLNQTHASTTDPVVRLFRKGKGIEANTVLYGAYADGEPQRPDHRSSPYCGYESRSAGHDGAHGGDLPGRHRLTVGGDRAYYSREFVQSLRALNAVPHVAQNRTGLSSAIDDRTTRHQGYTVSQRLRQRVEECAA